MGTFKNQAKQEVILTGKVFISCGQRPPHETQAAEEVCRLLRDEFHLEPYVAFGVQSLGDIMALTNELRACDYYLFIDFARRATKPEDLPCSLFTHQELALAHHLGFKEQVIAFQQEGAPFEGFLKYVQSNPAKFNTVSELVEKVRNFVRAKVRSCEGLESELFSQPCGQRINALRPNYL
jgi:hypothetical protein